MAKVSIIEDDPRMQRLYEHAFRLAGHEVSVSGDGKSGLESVKKFSPDLILLDIMMPVMNGMEVLDILKKDPNVAHIPVVVLTNVASGTLQSAEEAVEKGAVRYIIKSDHEPGEVVEIVKNILETES